MRIRVLLTGDTHLGFDDPVRARVSRRRRGPDFFACFEAALAPARRREVDLVVHGGDLLYRSRVPATLVERALEPVRAVAERGVPVFIVPGNHERSRLPFPILAAHRHLHVFDHPRTYEVEVRDVRVALGGFPYARAVRAGFPELLAQTKLLEHDAALRLLVMHHAVEGARVGPVNFTFRGGDDVVRAADLPSGVAAFLSGHIHRGQVLRRDLAGAPLPAPVMYPGSVERTSFAEKDESKAFLTIDLEPDDRGGRVHGWTWHRLPARPMRDVELPPVAGAARLLQALEARLRELPADAVVRVRFEEEPPAGVLGVLTAATLRRLVPPTMNVELAWRSRNERHADRERSPPVHPERSRGDNGDRTRA